MLFKNNFISLMDIFRYILLVKNNFFSNDFVLSELTNNIESLNNEMFFLKEINYTVVI